MTNYRVRGDGLNPAESGPPTFDEAFNERVIWRPSDNNLVTANFPPRHASSASGAIPAGYYLMNRVRVPANTPINAIHTYVHVAGAGLTNGGAAVYEADGTKSGETVSQTTAWASTGYKNMALAAAVPAKPSARWVWIAYAVTGTTGPSLGIASTVVSANAGIVSPPLAVGYIAGAWPFPSSVTLNPINWYEIWTGLT